MKFEHFALNVPEVLAHARWLTANLGFTIARQQEVPPHMTFLADETGRIVVELYTNPAAVIPDYKNQHPLVFHLALVAQDAGAERARLEKAGATVVSDDTHPDGTRLVMLRDPWGLSLQFCQRAKPFPMP